MSATAEITRTMSREDFLAFLEGRSDKERWQLIDGQAVMMTPPTLAHQRIAMNLGRALNDALEASGSTLFALIEIGLSMPEHRSFLPDADVVVVEDNVGYESYAERFYLAAEILSESNTREYMSLKVERYGGCPSNLHTLIIAQHECRVELWSRTKGWKGRVLRDRDALIDLPEFGFSMPLKALYRGTPLA